MNLTELFEKDRERYPTDKNTQHSYLPVYDRLFEKYQHQVCTICEVGIASGGSLKLWDDYFTKATIFGVDILGDELIKQRGVELSERAIIFKGDIKYYYNYFYDIDIAIDDGSHILEEQLEFARSMPFCCKSGGLIIIEDVLKQNVDYFKQIGQCEIIDLSAERPGQGDNILIIYKV